MQCEREPNPTSRLGQMRFNDALVAIEGADKDELLNIIGHTHRTIISVEMAPYEDPVEQEEFERQALAIQKKIGERCVELDIGVKVRADENVYAKLN